MGVKVHSTAIIEEGAELGVDVEVGPYSIIRQHVKIGDRSQIGPHVVIEGYTTLGEENRIFQFASIGAAPQDLKFKNEPSTLVIGARNTIREFVTLQPGTATGTMTTTIGDNNLFMANSHVAHDCRVGSFNVFANSSALAGHVQIGNRVIVGGLVAVHQFARIGDLAMLGGGSMVSSDVPPYCIGQGDRCVLRGVNTIGLERAGLNEEEVAEVRRVYRHLFSSVGHLKEKVETLPAPLAEKAHIKSMLAFIASSSRGICQPGKTAGGRDSR